MTGCNTVVLARPDPSKEWRFADDQWRRRQVENLSYLDTPFLGRIRLRSWVLGFFLGFAICRFAPAG